MCEELIFFTKPLGTRRAPPFSGFVTSRALTYSFGRLPRACIW